MTKEDAIKTLQELWRETNDPWYEEAYDMAIEALQKSIQKPPNKDKDLNLLCFLCGEDVDWHKCCEECSQVIKWE
jgi:hypothetical protein